MTAIRTLATLTILGSMTTLSGQVLFYEETWPSNLKTRFQTTLVAKRPFAADVHIVKNHSRFNSGQFSFMSSASWVTRKFYSKIDANILSGHQLNQKLYLYGGISYQIVKAEESKYKSWQASAAIELFTRGFQSLIIVNNILPGNELRDYNSLEIITSIRRRLSQKLTFHSRLSVDQYSLPALDLQLAYEPDQNWSFYPTINLWPIRLGLGISYGFSDQWNGLLGSRYDIRLGPTPVAGVMYRTE